MLVIIGLIVGGILMGRELIRAAELRAMVSDIEAFSTSVATFKLKYNGMPGDMSNATNFWPVNSSCATYPSLTNPDSAGVCNGNGDEQIGNTADSLFNEEPMFWKIMYQAGYGKFIPRGTATMNAGASVPFMRNNNPVNAGVGIAIYSDPAIFFPENTLEYSSPGDARWRGWKGWYWVVGVGDEWGLNTRPSLNSFEAHNIDQKVDDGLPINGAIKGQSINGVGTCTTGNVYKNETTLVSSTGAGYGCTMFFKLPI